MHAGAKGERDGSELRLVVSIDGPAASGKSTVARLAARALGYLYVDTGSMYRALTLKCLREGTDVADEAAVKEVFDRTEIEVDVASDSLDGRGVTLVRLDGEEVSLEIRRPEVNAKVSVVAGHPAIRHKMADLQRKLAEKGGAVLEGRDIGTAVFPDADVKFFLTADISERVRRRFHELRLHGVEVDADEVAADITTRDKLDSGRKAAPLAIPHDAVVIDTTDLSIRQVVELVLTEVRRKAGLRGKSMEGAGPTEGSP